jgi:hypothetical protein
VKAFAETGQLGALGAVRYAYVKQSPSGKSVVVTAWTDDKFNIFDLIPKENEDAPGVDFADIPRPTASNRVLSTRLEGTYFGVNVYRGFGSPKSVAAFYDEEMERRGWEVFDVTSDLEAKEAAEANHLPPPVEPEGKATGRLYAKGGVVLTLSSGIEEGATFSALGLAGATEKEMQSPWHR